MASNVGSVGNVGNTQNYYNQYVSNQKQEEIAAAGNNPASGTDPVDKFTPSSNAKGIDSATIKKLWSETGEAGNAVRKMVTVLLNKGDAAGQAFWAERADGRFEISEEDRKKAEEMIKEDGFFGAEKTTNRIMDFAKALVGENASDEQIEEMRSAVQKGFDQVSRSFGGFDNLPDVSKKTYESVMQSFDDWKASASSAATTVM